MTNYRDMKSWREGTIGKRARAIRSMISRREIDPKRSDGDHVVALGREAEDGSFEQDDMDVLGSCGIIARPADDVHVETITLFVGGDDNHPVAVGQLDHTRRYVLRDVGMEPDETIVYTSKTIVKILKDGTVELRNVNGIAVPLALKSDVEALQSRMDALEQAFLTHTHVTAGAGSPSPPTPIGGGEIGPTTPVVIAGTSKLKAE